MTVDADPPPEGQSSVHSVSRSELPHLRLLHYNDVYHVEAGSREPVGGIARFQHVVNYYRNDRAFEDQPKLLTVFSGDAFNPSLESSCTKGSHMVPVLNNIGTDVACVGNHDLDFGIPQFRYLSGRCNFPWLLANVLDPALGEDVPLANAYGSVMLTSSNGVKIGVLGLVEREWLDTINSLPPDLVYKSASATAKEIVPQLRKDGAEIIIAVTHARQPNDEKLANNIPEGLIDIILGGHDHDYRHSIINGMHLLRSGTDFKQLSYIKAWRKENGRWDFDITRRDIIGSIPEDPDAVALVEKSTAAIKTKMEKPIAYTTAPLDGRFTTVRKSESNLGNFVCDLMRIYHQADCAIMAAGTIRGDQIYPPGVLRLKDIMDCFPFEDPVVVIRITGQALWDALENGLSTYPALEGRFPQVSHIQLKFDPNAPPNKRLVSVNVGSSPIDMNKKYRLATRGYMTKGKDGYTSLLVESEGGEAEELIAEENGMLISTLLRQYFMSLKAVGRWTRCGASMGRHWSVVHDNLHGVHPIRESANPSPEIHPKAGSQGSLAARKGRAGSARTEDNGADADSDTENEDEDRDGEADAPTEPTGRERELVIMRKVLRKWWRLAGLPGEPSAGHEEEGEFVVGWTKGIAPRTEGRIVMVGETD